jgi:hypothetical protein
VLDLHDYHDFHRSSKDIITALIAEILSSSYRPRRALQVRLEKSSGICRRLDIPSPEDALILQTIVNVLEPVIRKNAPSKNAIYSRSHSTPKNASQLDETFSYHPLALWIEFQKRIVDFIDDCPFVVVTDIANFYDSMPLRQLRNVIASMGVFEESLIDFLFFMLEEFLWRPDYLPSSGVGLPQLNFDAPRLLAHCYLFEADAKVVSQVGSNFARWSDDINFGVQTEHDARKVLGKLDDILHTRGIRLNIGKTRILNAADGAVHFEIIENRNLTLIKNSVNAAKAEGLSMTKLKKIVRSRLSRFWRRTPPASWSKVIERYINLFGELGDPYLNHALLIV